MKIPEQIKLGIYDVKVTFEKNISRDEGRAGCSCGNKQEIRIDPDLCQQQIESTFIHEVIEQINFLYNIELEHHKICLLENAIYSFIKGNPDVFKDNESNKKIKPEAIATMPQEAKEELCSLLLMLEKARENKGE